MPTTQRPEPNDLDRIYKQRADRHWSLKSREASALPPEIAEWYMRQDPKALNAEYRARLNKEAGRKMREYLVRQMKGE